jgi:hypothetical protein
MIDHTGIGVVDVGRSAAFHDMALEALGLRGMMQILENVGSQGIGYGVSFPIFWIDRFHVHSMRQHTAFAAKSRTEVDTFYAAALKAGATDSDAPGLRSQIITLRLCSIRTVTISRRSSAVTDTSHQAEAASAESYFNRDRADLRITPALLAPSRSSVFRCGRRSATAVAGAIDHRAEHLLVERVAAEAEIGIGLAPRRTCPRAREVVLDAPAVGEAHALGMTGRNRFERGLPDQRIEDLDERLVDKVADRTPCLDAARVYVAGRLDGNF